MEFLNSSFFVYDNAVLIHLFLRNLQAAICSYLDIESTNQLPSMALVSNPLANETESIEPNVRYEFYVNIFF